MPKLGLQACFLLASNHPGQGPFRAQQRHCRMFCTLRCQVHKQQGRLAGWWAGVWVSPLTQALLATGRAGAQIHWFSIINSCVTVLLLTGFLATILMRVLKNDFVRFGNDEEAGACLILTQRSP